MQVCNLLVYPFVQSGLRVGNLVRVEGRDDSVKLVDGKLDLGELQLVGKSNRSRAFADTYSKVRILHNCTTSSFKII